MADSADNKQGTKNKEQKTKGKAGMDLAKVKPGMTVKVHQRIKEIGRGKDAGKTKERVQVFEGIVIARHGGMTASATVTVRKISEGIGVEKIFPLHSPLIEKIVPVKLAKVRRSKLYFLRNSKKRLREKKIT